MIHLTPTKVLKNTLPLVSISFHDVAYDRRSSFKGNTWLNKVYDEFVMDLPVNTLYAPVSDASRKAMAKVANDMVALIDDAGVTWRYRRFKAEPRPLYTYEQTPYEPEFLCIEFSYLNHSALGVMLRLAGFDSRDWKLFSITQDKFKLSEATVPKSLRPVDLTALGQEIVKHFKKPLGNILVNDDSDICGNDKNKMLYFVAHFKSLVPDLNIADMTAQYPWMVEGDLKKNYIKPIPWDVSVPIDKPAAKAIIKILKNITQKSGEKAWFTVNGNKITLVRRTKLHYNSKFNGVPIVVAAWDYDGFYPPCELDQVYYDPQNLVMALRHIDAVGEIKVCHRGVVGITMETEQVEYAYYLRGWTN